MPISTALKCGGLLMAIWFNWSALSPLLEKYVDDGTRDLCTA